MGLDGDAARTDTEAERDRKVHDEAPLEASDDRGEGHFCGSWRNGERELQAESESGYGEVAGGCERRGGRLTGCVDWGGSEMVER